jgi:hypothetical protein
MCNKSKDADGAIPLPPTIGLVCFRIPCSRKETLL